MGRHGRTVRLGSVAIAIGFGAAGLLPLTPAEAATWHCLADGGVEIRGDGVTPAASTHQFTAEFALTCIDAGGTLADGVVMLSGTDMGTCASSSASGLAEGSVGDETFEDLGFAFTRVGLSVVGGWDADGDGQADDTHFAFAGLPRSDGGTCMPDDPLTGADAVGPMSVPLM